jgi:hypothetical protein
MNEENNKNDDKKSSKITSPMNVAVAFQSIANRVQKDGGELELEFKR